MFFIPNYQFYKTHREKLIESFLKFQNITICCDMKGAKPTNQRIKFINKQIFSSGMGFYDLIDSLLFSCSLIKKDPSRKVFFISVRLILVGSLISIFFPRKKFFFILFEVAYFLVFISII